MVEDAPDHSLRVRMLGAFSLTVSGVPVLSWRAGKARTLFQYLVSHRERLVLRETLYQALWPGREWSPSSSSLKVAVHAVRRALGVGPRGCERCGIGIEHRDFGYVLHADNVWVDIEDFEAKIDAGRAADRRGEVRAALSRYREAMELYRGDFLQEESGDWIVEHREWYRSLALHALTRLSAVALDHDDVGDVLRWSARLIELEPYREETYRLLINMCGRLGDRKAAKAWFDRCVSRLRGDLGVEPSPATVQAYVSAARGRTSIVPRPARRSA
ncbi:AfsR/SARP family transcriptional regulator [Thermoactinospora rubra]|uniref:AfsR/SARP family transcriptional regulator n=1 Tax=Thermoactinospora rubra TaxID=1088767 RepID=UPI000A114EC2|nr:BTAD domain-containing putative transcriptional regulator [Thermoactinospora rubra]